MSLGYLVALTTIVFFEIYGFRQTDYNIIHDRFILEEYNRSIVSNPKCGLFTYNRSTKTKVINLSATFLKMDSQIYLSAATFKFLSNEYRPFPLNVTFNFCDEFNKNTFGLQSIKNFSNFRVCPPPLGHIHVDNYIIQEDKFPPYIPGGSYKLAVNVRFREAFVANGSWYGRIEPRLTRWEH